MFEIDEDLGDEEPVLSIDKCGIDSLEYLECNYGQFYHKYILGGRPCLIKNISKTWKCQNDWLVHDKPNCKILSERYGHLKCTVSKCNRQYFNAHEMFESTVDDFLNYWTNYQLSSNDCRYLKDLHLSQFDKNFYEVPTIFQSDWLNEYCLAKTNDDYRFVYMGPEKSWTPLHVDVFQSFSWSVNICGQKLWYLFEPGVEQFLKTDSKHTFFEENLESVLMQKNIRYKKVLQNANDGIFVPSGWYHQVHNISDTISVNHNWINACNIENVWKAMLVTLEEVQNEFNSEKSAFGTNLEWIEHCQLALSTIFGMNFKEFENFLQFIILQRTKMINELNNSMFGRNHLLYDLKLAKKVLNNLKLHFDFIVYNNL